MTAPQRVLIGCETSGMVRQAFLAAGHDAWSCDLLPAEDRYRQVYLARKDQPELQHRPFAARELKVMHRGGKRRPASGATMAALRAAGWAEKVRVIATDPDAPFQVQTDKTAWQITEEGRKAIAACPEQYPGDPVYGKD